MQTLTIKTIDQTVGHFWSGWVAGSAIIAGGKLWCVLVNPQLRVSELLGYIGTPFFGRQLAVAGAVYYLTTSLLFAFTNTQETTDPNLTLTLKVVAIKGIGAALGSVAAAATTHSAYEVLFFSACLYSVAALLYNLNGVQEGGHSRREWPVFGSGKKELVDTASS